MEVDPKDITTKWYEANLQVLRELGMYAIKTLVTLNSGAIVVMLTFLGNAAAQTKYTLDLSSIKQALVCFLLGITSTAIVVAISYINIAIMSPFDHSKGLGTNLSLLIYILFSVLAFVAFFLGVLTVINGVIQS